LTTKFGVESTSREKTSRRATMANQITLEQYQSANRELRRREEKRGFRIHGIVYLFVNAILVTANLLFVPEFLWFFFPLAGWGLGLTMHYVFGIRRLSRSITRQEERVVEEARCVSNG
jgi:hypothetical protein